MNKARIKQEYTVFGSFLTDAALGVLIGGMWFLILVAFLSW